VTVRNSVVHDVAGDGILVEEAKHALIERNVAWDTGMQYTETIGTPDGIWEWMCEDCTVQYNEGFFATLPVWMAASSTSTAATSTTSCNTTLPMIRRDIVSRCLELTARKEPAGTTSCAGISA